MRTTTIVMVLTLALAAVGPTPGQGQAPAATPPATATTLVGAWNGQWTGSTGAGNGVVELVLARVPGRDTLLGHFTFVTGGTSRTLRYEGRLEDGRLQFPLVGEGRIVLEPQEAPRPSSAATLQGEWVDARGALPAPSGTLRLTRVPI